MEPTLRQESPAWVAFVQIAFAISLGLMVVGIAVLPLDLWVRGYLAIGLFFCVSSTITLSKTLRDNHEAKKIISRIQEVKTEQMLKDYELRP